MTRLKLFGRRRPAFDLFDWRTVPEVDAEELAMWRSRTDAKERQFPLQVALQVHDELERTLMGAERMDALRLSEIRGGIKALARFAQVYQATMARDTTPPPRRAGGYDMGTPRRAGGCDMTRPETGGE